MDLDFLKDKLEKRKGENRYRTLQTLGSGIDFCSNDYLGLAREKVKTARSTNWSGATGSRLISGESKEIQELERSIAAYHGAESALIFNSGYTANISLLSAVTSRHDRIYYDSDCHASIRDGTRLSLAQSFSFQHNCLTSLAEKLRQSDKRAFVVVEGVYSMDGMTAPLSELAVLCHEHDAYLIVDEAHSVGLYGENGAGLAVELGVEEETFARVITFGKAFGCFGAAVIGSKTLREYLVNFARPFIYTTALPPNCIQSIANGYSVVQCADERRSRVFGLANYFDQVAQELLSSYTPTPSPVKSIIIPGEELLKSVSLNLSEKGFEVYPIVSPTVKAGSERLRIVVHSYNAEEEIEKLLLHLQELI